VILSNILAFGFAVKGALPPYTPAAAKGSSEAKNRVRKAVFGL